MKSTVAGAVEACQPGAALRALAAVALAASALAGAGCGGGGPTPTGTLKAFYDAVQRQDLDRLYCLMAGAAEAAELGATDAERRAGFGDWARAYYEAYDAGRDAGRVELDEQGLGIVKLFSLGRGAFVTYRTVDRPDEDTVVVEGDIRFGYAHVDLSPFSPGTTFYVCGAPVGRVYPVRVPVSGEATVQALDRVRVRWTLVRKAPTEACPDGWAVASAEPVEGSAETSEITWVF